MHLHEIIEPDENYFLLGWVRHVKNADDVNWLSDIRSASSERLRWCKANHKNSIKFSYGISSHIYALIGIVKDKTIITECKFATSIGYIDHEDTLHQSGFITSCPTITFNDNFLGSLKYLERMKFHPSEELIFLIPDNR